MARDPSLPLQASVFNALANAEAIDVATVFETVPSGTPLPWIIIGDDIIEGDDEAGPHARATVIVDVFESDKLVLKTLVNAIIEALDLPLEIEGFIVGEWGWENTRYLRERDGKTHHAAVEFEFLLIPTS